MAFVESKYFLGFPGLYKKHCIAITENNDFILLKIIVQAL